MIRRYANAEDILEDFYDLRLKHYHLRKEHLLEKLKQEWTRLENKARFIKAIISGDLCVQSRKRCDVIADLRRLNYDPLPKTAKGDAHDEPEDSTSDSSTDYDYLLSMPIYSLTAEKVADLLRQLEAKKAEIDQLLALSPVDLWNRDLDAFEAAWRADLAKDELHAEEGPGSNLGAKKGVPRKKAAGKKASDEAIVEVAVTKKTLPSKKAKVEPAELIETASIIAAEPVQQPVAINLEDELMNLPLAERINRMLAYKPVSLHQSVGSTSTSATNSTASINAFGRSVDTSESVSASIFGRPAAAQKAVAAKKRASAAAPRKKAGIAAAKPAVAMAAQKRPSESDSFDDEDDSRTAGKDTIATGATSRPVRAVRKATIVESDDDDAYTMEVEDEYSEDESDA